MMTDHAIAPRRQFLTRLRRKVDREGNIPPMRITDTGPDWKNGLLAVALLSLGLLLIDMTDRGEEQRIAVEDARAEAARERALRLALDDAPQVRLEGQGYVCKTIRVRQEWVDVVADRCKRLGELLRVARATE